MVWSIRDRATFGALRRATSRSRRGHVTVACVGGGDEPVLRVAYAVGKQVGGAVARNRLRRRLRAVVREIAPELSSGAYLVTAGREAAGISHEELKTQVTAAMTAAAEARRR